MKRNINSIICVSALAASLLASCQADFEDINRDHRQPTETQLEQDNLNVGGFVTSFEESIFPVGSSGTGYVNDYQIPYTLAGACWIGYMAPAQNKWVGRGFPSYALKPWSQYTYNVMAGNAFRNFLDVKKRTANDPEGLAIAQIIKVAAVHKATDTFGPIPYTKAGIAGATTAEYDSQEDVYKAMLKDLDDAVQALSNGGHDVFPKYDIIYEGNYTKWCKFANSLMLRLAMRIVYANPTLAQQYAEKAINNPYGVIESAKDAAQLSKGAGVSLRNPLVIINGSYNDVRMGAEIESYLKGYDDPRIASYFVKSKNNGIEGYYGVRSSIPNTTDYLDKTKSSSLNVQDATPIYIMKASEVYFLRAEGALRGWNMGGTAQHFYEEGILHGNCEDPEMKSMDGEGPSGQGNVNWYDAWIHQYMEQENPVAYVYKDPTGDTPDAASPIHVGVKWNDGDSQETKLEKIITQKYLATYPNGFEAWVDLRRTGFPRMLPVLNIDEADGSLVPGDIMRRLPFPGTSDIATKQDVDNTGIPALGGPDKMATRLFWDRLTPNF